MGRGPGDVRSRSVLGDPASAAASLAGPVDETGAGAVRPGEGDEDSGLLHGLVTT